MFSIIRDLSSRCFTLRLTGMFCGENGRVILPIRRIFSSENFRFLKLRFSLHAMISLLSVSGYEVLDIISKGRNSQLHRAFCTKSEKIVCVRIFNLEDFYKEDLETALGMLSEEIRAMKAVCKYKNLVQYIESFISGSNFYIVTEQLEGSINSILRFNDREKYSLLTKKQPVFFVKDLELLRIILKKTLYAIKNCHENGIIHSNVKGDYILVSKDGEIKLTGFYRAIFTVKFFERFFISKSRKGDDVFQYREDQIDVSWTAPEILKLDEANENVFDEKVDIWSFGMSILELVYGKIPFLQVVGEDDDDEEEEEEGEGDGKGRKSLTKLINCILVEPSLTLLDNEGVNSCVLSPLLKEVVDMCLKKDPNERPTADELLQHQFFQLKKRHKKICEKEYVRKALNLDNLPSLYDRNVILSRVVERPRMETCQETCSIRPPLVQFNFDTSDDDKLLESLEQMTIPTSPHGTIDNSTRVLEATIESINEKKDMENELLVLREEVKKYKRIVKDLKKRAEEQRKGK